MKTLKRFLLLVVIISMVILLPKFVKAETPFKITEKNIVLNQETYLTYEGGSGTITWTSSDPSIVSVTDGGMLKGLKIGEVTITATRGEETSSCTVKVIYESITLMGNSGMTYMDMELVLGVHNSEKLSAKVVDNSGTAVSGAVIKYTTSDSSIATVDTNGNVTAVKAGEATITAETAGVSDTIKVVVSESIPGIDFSKAKAQIMYDGFGNFQDIKIDGINLGNSNKHFYYFMITPDSTKKELKLTKSGALDTDQMEATMFIENGEENYIYKSGFEKYTELNQDLYLWVIESISNPGYYDESGEYVTTSTNYVIEGKKLERPALPPLNLILKSFNIGRWGNTSTESEDAFTHINFDFPTATESRKFTLKIGKVTDNTILNKIKNNDYSGITDLLQYAKTHDAIYSDNLVTTSLAYYRNDGDLFDGKKLLQDDAYYYIYAVFDDENGKYYPIEGVTLGQAYFSDVSDYWNLNAYTASNFDWNGLKPSYTPTNTDPTVAPTKIPQTGQSVIVAAALLSVVGLGVYTHRRLKNYRDVR